MRRITRPNSGAAEHGTITAASSGGVSVASPILGAQLEQDVMASTNEDVVVLATAPLGNGRLLIMRHLPDRGTVEIGWWEREESGSIAPGSAVLELVAEAVEFAAVARLCEGLAGIRWDAAGEGEKLAETPLFTDGAHVAAVRSGTGMMLVRHPEGGDLVLPSPAALGLLIGLFPIALRQLGTLGFGLIQHEEQASLETADDQA